MGIEEKIEAAQAALRAVLVEYERERAGRTAPRTMPPRAPPYPMTWVKLDRYVELSGDTVDSVQSRRKVGKWLDGVQCKIVDGRLWINLPAAQRWVEDWDTNAPSLATGRR